MSKLSEQAINRINELKAEGKLVALDPATFPSQFTLVTCGGPNEAPKITHKLLEHGKQFFTSAHPGGALCADASSSLGSRADLIAQDINFVKDKLGYTYVSFMATLPCVAANEANLTVDDEIETLKKAVAHMKTKTEGVEIVPSLYVYGDGAEFYALN